MRLMKPFSVAPSILMYHSVADHIDEPFSVAVDDFRKQIVWLNENGFEIVSLEALLQLLQGCDYAGLHKKVVITFDDGYRDFVTNALPILQEYEATATVYLVTELLGGVSEWYQHGETEALMTEEEVRYIKERGISLGSHTVTHANLARVNNEELQYQLRESHKVLSRFGESFCTFSYPWGQWTQLVVSAVKETGYECGLAVGEQTSISLKNRYLLPRIPMRRDMDIGSFQSLLTRTNLDRALRRSYRSLRGFIYRTVR